MLARATYGCASASELLGQKCGASAAVSGWMSLGRTAPRVVLTLHLERFKKLADLLIGSEDLWRQRPFVQLPSPWEADRPGLSAALRSLSRSEILRFDCRPTEIPAVREAIPGLVAELEGCCAWPALPAVPAGSIPMPAPKRVRRRKWNQVVSFIDAVSSQPHQGVTKWVDWCSGKGHLGRALHQTEGVPVTCIEKNQSLCETGRNEAGLAGASLEFSCCDVRDGSNVALLDATTGLVALHACGYLNTSLIRQAVDKKVPFVAVAPCCYQRIDGMHYHPLSRQGSTYNVPLTRHELRLPSLDETMTSEKKRALRRKEHAFRLGVDLLHREKTGIDAYYPLGPVKPAWLKNDFAYFATTIASEKNIPLPSRINWQNAESAGWSRFYESSAISLARGLFRRAIESWLILDRALFLESRGYTVSIGTFCSRDLTPRNLMLIAHLNSQQA